MADSDIGTNGTHSPCRGGGRLDGPKNSNGSDDYVKKRRKESRNWFGEFELDHLKIKVSGSAIVWSGIAIGGASGAIAVAATITKIIWKLFGDE